MGVFLFGILFGLGLIVIANVGSWLQHRNDAEIERRMDADLQRRLREIDARGEEAQRAIDEGRWRDLTEILKL